MPEETHAHLVAAKPVRSPLHIQTNTQINTSTSPVSHKDVKIVRVRRRSSFVRRLDSSEDLPSENDSIFVAEYLSPYASEESGSGYKLDTWEKSEPQIPLSPRLELPSLSLSSPTAESNNNNDENDELVNSSHRLAIGTTPILYGHGTPLTTIIEQKSSNPTLRNSTSSRTSATRSLARPRSVSDLTTSSTSSLPHLHRSAPTTLPSTNPSSPLKNLHASTSGLIRRLESLSDSSTPSIKLSWPAGYNPDSQRALLPTWRTKSSIWSESVGSAPGSPEEVYAKPLRPLRPPVERPGTPEGMPSWTAAQRRGVVRARDAHVQEEGEETRRGWRVHEASSMLSRLFSNRLRGGEGASHAPTTANSGYGVRGPWDAVPSQRRNVPSPVLRGAPRFRAQRSGYGVMRLEMHPFAREGGWLGGGERKDGDDAPVAVQTTNPVPVPLAALGGNRVEGTGEATATATASGSQHGQGHGNGQGHGYRQLSLRRKGKRRPGQRVRFTPSTIDPSTTTQPGSGTGAFGVADVKVCPHKRSSAANTNVGGLPESDSAPVVVEGASAVPGINIQTTPCQSLPLSLPLPAPSSPAAQVIDSASSPPVQKSNAFRGRTRCWRCTLEGAAEKMDRAWERSAKWCCWYCCGIEMEEGEVGGRGRGIGVGGRGGGLTGDDAVAERERERVGVRVRSFAGVV